MNKKNDNQPCLSAKGTPYFPKNVNAAASSSDTKDEEQQQDFLVFHLEV